MAPQLSFVTSMLGLQLQEKLSRVQSQLHSLRAESASLTAGPEACPASLAAGPEACPASLGAGPEPCPEGGAEGSNDDKFHQRIATLKEEFRDLLAELQRRRSTPDGSTVVYEVSPGGSTIICEVVEYLDSGDIF